MDQKEKKGSRSEGKVLPTRVQIRRVYRVSENLSRSSLRGRNMRNPLELRWLVYIVEVRLKPLFSLMELE